ncbi:MAG TPA: zf-HC2 domain-containing protein [Blastocatellia bacterium]|nr:zf-HC2 domain-containing protein [Blastocatellia bacterium]
MFGKNEDRVIDNLLRANTRGRGGPDLDCREFDPDLANAYIERSLTSAERAGYERHLAECHPCRSNVVALARMAEAEVAPALAARSVREPGRFASLKGLFTTPAMPRVAAAALAVIVLAVSIPLLLSSGERRAPEQNAFSDVAASPSGAEARQASPGLSRQEAQQDAVDNPKPGAATLPTSAPRSAGGEPEQTAAVYGETAAGKQQPVAPDATASGAAGPARVEPPRTEKVEDKSAAESSSQSRAAEGDNQIVAKDQPAPPPPPAPAAEASAPLKRIDPDEARRLRQPDKEAVSVTMKPGVVGGAPGLEREERSAIRSDSGVAPPSESGRASGDRRGLAEPSPRAKRDEVNTGGAAFASRGSATRKVGGKKFWFSKDTWIDKDYNPNRELPVVTVERDSDIYKELLTKRSGLKLYLMGFGEGERAIFVYKGTVYRLVPQNGR